MQKKFSLDSFKDALRTDKEFKAKISEVSDMLDFDNGSAIIHRENIGKYLETYLCKDENDLEDTLWYNYGVYVKIV